MLKCPTENETDYVKKCLELASSKELKEVICFQYQRMLRYGGSWHLENRALLPGYIFLSQSRAEKPDKKAGKEEISAKKNSRGSKEVQRMVERTADRTVGERLPFMTPCKVSCLKELCSEGNLIGMSQGVIKDGIPVVIHGPLKGREHLIRKINRHKRTAEIELQLAGQTERMVVGLEICEKQVSLKQG